MELPDSATTVLLSVPSVSPADGSVCADLLACNGPDHPNVLYIDFVRTPRDRIQDRQQAEHPFGELAIISVETYTRSASSAEPVEHDSLSPIVETVSDPSNLTQFGVTITRCLERWEDSEKPLCVCFHSISSFLHYVDLSTAFKFLNVVQAQLSNADARGHFHIEPGAHDEQTIRRLSPLFDAIVEADVNGAVELTTR